MSNTEPTQELGGTYRRRDEVYEFLSRRRVMILLTTVPVLALFTFISLIPMAWGIVTTFFEVPLYTTWDWTWVGLSNYSLVLSREIFQQSFIRAVYFALGSVVVQLVFGVGLALLVNRSFRFAGAIRAIVMLPYLIPTAVVAYIAMWLGNSQYGILNQILVDVGLINSPIAWFGNAELVMPALIVANSWKFSIFVTLMTLARLQGIPDEYYEAATMAGANRYQRFRDVTLPNLKGVIFIVLLLRGIWMFNKFDIIWILTRGGPAEASKTLPIYGYNLAFQSSELSQATTVSTIMFAVLLVVAILYFHFLNPSEEVRVE
ncbi:carbohydrate ABC transporter permease [Halomarina salina]|uniref:Carbohydrate ABC transporter permease n=1 Tax=Halomarina salina TaxID=1872699 RepID=A0ABD5RU64_9EURY|nr:sugar ABC transporter permease [Halomarina salina]